MAIEQQPESPRGIGRSLGAWYVTECSTKGQHPSETDIVQQLMTAVENSSALADDDDEVRYQFWRDISEEAYRFMLNAGNTVARARQAFGNTMRSLVGMQQTEPVTFPWSWSDNQITGAYLHCSDAIRHAEFEKEYQRNSAERVRNDQMAPALVTIRDAVAAGQVTSQNIIPALLRQLTMQEAMYFSGPYTSAKREKLIALCQQESVELLTKPAGTYVDDEFLENMLFLLEIVKLAPIRVLHQQNFPLGTSAVTGLPHFPLKDIEHALRIATQKLAEARHLAAPYIPDFGPTVERLEQWRDQVAAQEKQER